MDRFVSLVCELKFRFRSCGNKTPSIENRFVGNTNRCERKQVNCWLWRAFGPVLIRFPCQRRMTDYNWSKNMKVLQLLVFISVRRKSDKRDKSSLIIMQNEDLLK